MANYLYTLTQAKALRDQRYHRKPGLRLRNVEDIRQFVAEVELCLLFPVQTLEMPSLYQAVCGHANPTDTSLRDTNIGLTWNTKDHALDKRWWYYGKLVKSKATLVSMDLFSSFYALSENFGDPDDYLTEYEAGTLSADAKNIYEALLNEGRLHAIDLKRKVGLYGDERKGKFDKAINELQGGLKILPTGVAEAGAWRYAFIYDLLWRWLPDVPKQAQAISRPEARVNILARHLRNVIYVTPKEISRMFGWTKVEVEATIATLVAGAHAVTGNVGKGLPSAAVVWCGD